MKDDYEIGGMVPEYCLMVSENQAKQWRQRSVSKEKEAGGSVKNNHRRSLLPDRTGNYLTELEAIQRGYSDPQVSSGKKIRLQERAVTVCDKIGNVFLKT